MDGKLLSSELHTHDIYFDFNSIHQLVNYTSSAGNLSDRCHKQRVGRTQVKGLQENHMGLKEVIQGREGKAHVLLLLFSVSTKAILKFVVRILLLSVGTARNHTSTDVESLLM